MKRNFNEMLLRQWSFKKYLCVGLDIDYTKIPFAFLEKHAGKTPLHIMKLFNEDVINQTNHVVCAYKPNSAFYEAIGEQGFELLKHTVEHIKKVAPNIPIILDYKRGDIGNTNNGYVDMAFGKSGYDVDAVTVSPYLGSEAMKPFLDQKEKGVIVLCCTSNPGAGEFQDLLAINLKGETKPLYEIVAETVRDTWNYNNNCLLVTGATYPERILNIRSIAPNIPFLIPGIGTQGGDLEKTMRAGMIADNEKGDGIIINESRSIIFAPNPGEAAIKRAEEIRTLRDIIRYGNT